MQLLLSEADESSRAELFAVSTSLTSVAHLAAGLLGARLVAYFDSYTAVFAISAAFRSLPAVFLLSPALGRRVAAMPRWFFRVISARADGGQIRVPIVEGGREDGASDGGD